MRRKIDREGTSRIGLLYLVLTVMFIVVFLYSVTLGRFSLSLPELLNMIWSKTFHLPQTWSDGAEIALFNIRIPRIVAAALVGGGLAAAGAVYQGLFKNPMVSPDLLGASTGAGFGACAAISLSLSTFGVQTAAFICGIIAVMLAYGIARVVSRSSNMLFTLILTGMVISTMFSSLISVLKFVADPNDKLPAITFWLMGGLTAVKLSDVTALLVPVAAALIPILLLRYQLNIISFGDQEAKTVIAFSISSLLVELFRYITGILEFCSACTVDCSLVITTSGVKAIMFSTLGVLPKSGPLAICGARIV